jgi:predicted unusual protein kinase regulating ubiquinone biosynthesis (AarF/ABC1/UbiB family)
MLIVLGVLLAGFVLGKYVVSRRNRAGISTSITSRAAAMGGLATRSAARKAALRMRQVLASKARKQELERRYHLKTSAEVTEMMGQMKGVFMKIGQIASFAHEGLPPEARKMLETLQKDAPPMDFSLVREVLESELGPIAEHFAELDQEPLAAASIGQVHRARLPSGEEVVVKVQYPGVDRAISSDLRFTQGLVSMGSAFFRNTDSAAMVEEIKARLLDELDYQKEADNQERFAAIWEGHPLIRIPRVFRSHTTRRVLTQGYAQGLTFNDFLAVATPEEKRLAVLVLNDFVFDSMHLFEVFNGDPHPGNYLFHEDGGITFLDFGCVKRFAGPFLHELRRLNRAIIEGDEAEFEASLRATGIILPGRPYDREVSWSFFGYHARPFARDEVFTFTEDYLREAAETMRIERIRRFNLPPDLVFFNRITFGLNAIFQRLGASENFHRLYRRYMYPAEAVPPALAAAGVALPPRFIPARPWPVEEPSA